MSFSPFATVHRRSDRADRLAGGVLALHAEDGLVDRLAARLQDPPL